MSQYGFYCYHSCQVWHWSIVCLSMDYILIIAVRSGTGVLYVSVCIILLSELSGLTQEYCTSQYGFHCYHNCQVWHWSIVVSAQILLLSQLSGLALEYCMSQYGLYCYYSCQVWHWSIVRLSIDFIVILAVRSGTGEIVCLSIDSVFIIAVRSGTGVLYVSVWIILLSQLSGLALEYCTSQYGFFSYHSCQVWHWSNVRLSMDYICIISVRFTGVFYVSVWIIFLSQLSGLALEYWSQYILLLSQLSGLALEYCTSHGFYCYHSCQVWHWSIVRLSIDYIVIIAVRFDPGVLYLSIWIILLSQLSGLALEYCTFQYGFYCYHSCQVQHWSIVRLCMDSFLIIAVRSDTGIMYISVWIIFVS